MFRKIYKYKYFYFNFSKGSFALIDFGGVDVPFTCLAEFLRRTNHFQPFLFGKTLETYASFSHCLHTICENNQMPAKHPVQFGFLELSQPIYQDQFIIKSQNNQTFFGVHVVGQFDFRKSHG